MYHADAEYATRTLAAAMYPAEQWVQAPDPGIYIASSRHRAAKKSHSEAQKLGRELAQCARLTRRGSIVFLLPENANESRPAADAIIDGEVVELKKVTGNRTTIGTDFRGAYHQGAATMHKFPALVSSHSVFLDMDTQETVASIHGKLAGELKTKTDLGSVICYFKNSGELYQWSYAELRKSIKKDKKHLT
jgi:hypothetical protein